MCKRQKRFEGSNPFLSAKNPVFTPFYPEFLRIWGFLCLFRPEPLKLGALIGGLKSESQKVHLGRCKLLINKQLIQKNLVNILPRNHPIIQATSQTNAP